MRKKSSLSDSVDGESKSFAVKPSNLISKDGVAPEFVCDIGGIKIPCKAELFVNAYYNELGCMIKWLKKSFFGVFCSDLGTFTSLLLQNTQKPLHIF